ncbi:MAG: hydrogenase maturation protease [Actinomycetota bacterium]|nr:hydrogenase maturation protease [Actinomycetota bacterium]
MNKKNQNFSNQSSGKKLFKIIGFGNIYMGDDAIGPLIIDELRKDKTFENSDNVVLFDCETSGIDLIFMVNENEEIIIIDAIDAGQEVGEIITFDINDVDTFVSSRIKSYSMHDIALAEVFNIMKSMNIKINATLIGIKPKTIELGDGLSKEIESKIPAIIKAVKDRISI